MRLVKKRRMETSEIMSSCMDKSCALTTTTATASLCSPPAENTVFKFDAPFADVVLASVGRSQSSSSSFQPLNHSSSMSSAADLTASSSSSTNDDIAVVRPVIDRHVKVGSSLPDSMIVSNFNRLSTNHQSSLLLKLLDLCDKKQLAMVANSVMPRLKIDILKNVPREIAIHVMSYLPVKSICRLGRTSKLHSQIVDDNHLWKVLCERYGYIPSYNPVINDRNTRRKSFTALSVLDGLGYRTPSPPCSDIQNVPNSFRRNSAPASPDSLRDPYYKNVFRRNYMIDTNWRQGNCIKYTIEGPAIAIVTSLQFDDRYLVLGTDCDEYGFLEVFDSSTGSHRRSFRGHQGGVWALEFMNNVLVSGGCDRSLRVWDLETGQCKLALAGHSSTIRCLKMLSTTHAVTGSRDKTVRLWNILKGECEHVFRGHTDSIRCLAVHDKILVTGSYDCTVRVWDLEKKRCLHVLEDHHAQIYSIAFDGIHICSGSLDADVRVFDARTGESLWLFEGHNALVGHIQLHGDTLVTGGSDGRICMWDIETGQLTRRINAHHTSVATLQFENGRILSGGDDGVKIWDAETGEFIRYALQGVTGVWRLQFQSSRLVVAAQRDQMSTIEIMDYDMHSGN